MEVEVVETVIESPHPITKVLDVIVALISNFMSSLAYPFRVLRRNSTVVRNALLFVTLLAFTSFAYRTAPGTTAAATIEDAWSTWTNLRGGDISKLGLPDLLRQGARADRNKRRFLERINNAADATMSDEQFQRILDGYNAWEAYSDRIDNRLIALADGQKQFDGQMEGLEQRIVGLDERARQDQAFVGQLEDRIERAKETFDEEKLVVSDLGKRYEELETRLEQAVETRALEQRNAIQDELKELERSVMEVYESTRRRLMSAIRSQNETAKSTEERFDALAAEHRRDRDQMMSNQEELKGNLEGVKKWAADAWASAFDAHTQIREEVNAYDRQTGAQLEELEARHVQHAAQMHSMREQMANIESLKTQLQDRLAELDGDRLKLTTPRKKSVLDATAAPDFALETAGGRVVPKLTSATYFAGYDIPFLDYFGMRRVRGKRPNAAIQTDLNPGSCWPLRGAHGQIGISLVAPILPSSLTLSHPPRHLWTGAIEGMSSPRAFELWAVYDKDRFPHMHLHLPAVRSSSPPLTERHIPAGVLLLEDQYDPENPVARFEIGKDARDMVDRVAKVHGRGVDTVVLRVVSNWGHREWTCLYRVQVHGERFL
ncbi:hypothetical protein HKX48_006371 [Thoreauomyces humboldtii]|nr:hypothetical protein HKX48_006371 [Thoreauomyces humboldtii]